MKNKVFSAVAAAAVLALPVWAVMKDSGLNVGETVTPFHPTHVAGPDKGTTKCPPCTYGNRPAVQVWFHEEEQATAEGILLAMHEAVNKHKAKEFKAFGIFVAECEGCLAKVKNITDKMKYQDVGVATVLHENPAIEAYKINVEPTVKNTVLVYKDKKVVAKLVNIKADKEGIANLNAVIEKAL
jgi:hypothetical protein